MRSPGPDTNKGRGLTSAKGPSSGLWNRIRCATWVLEIANGILGRCTKIAETFEATTAARFFRALASNVTQK